MLLIRSYADEDLEELLQLHTETILAINPASYASEILMAWSYKDEHSKELWRNVLRSSYSLVGEENGRIVGFANLFLEQGYLDRLYVHKDFQRQGIAQALLEALLEKAQAEKIEKITVEASIPARPFFETNAFTLIVEQEKSLGDNLKVVNYVMEKVL